MKGKTIAIQVALVSALLFCLCAPLQFGQTASAQSGSTWSKYGPAARYQHTAIYDASSDKMVIFAGKHTTGSQNFNDVWWVTNVTTVACLPPCSLQWMLAGSTGSLPAARFGHTAVYDSANLRMMVFGGGEGVTIPPPCENDVHVLENATGVGGTPKWITLKPAGTLPAARYSHTAVYDAADNEMIVFGGNDCGLTYFNDVWVLSFANGLGGTPTWSQLSPSGSAPGPRAFASAVYDAVNDNMIVFGGYNGSPYGDLWMLTHASGVSGSPAWVQLNPTGTAPPATYQHSAVYDPASNRMIIYGGDTATATDLTNTWVLANANGIGGTPFWTQTSSSGPPRALQSAIYASSANKMVIFGGLVPTSEQGNPVDDHVWVLNDANGL